MARPGSDPNSRQLIPDKGSLDQALLSLSEKSDSLYKKSLFPVHNYYSEISRVCAELICLSVQVWFVEVAG